MYAPPFRHRLVDDQTDTRCLSRSEDLVPLTPVLTERAEHSVLVAHKQHGVDLVPQCSATPHEPAAVPFLEPGLRCDDHSVFERGEPQPRCPACQYIEVDPHRNCHPRRFSIRSAHRRTGRYADRWLKLVEPLRLRRRRDQKHQSTAHQIL